MVDSTEGTTAVSVRDGVGGARHYIGSANVEVVELSRAALCLSCLGLRSKCNDQEEQYYCSLRADTDKGVLDGCHDHFLCFLSNTNTNT
jgi:hypothetical protein